jgi:DNA-binding transcriptional regulator YiaG
MKDLEPCTGQDLARERRAVGLTQPQIAAAMGLTRVTIANWEARAFISGLAAHRYRTALERAAEARKATA